MTGPGKPSWRAHIRQRRPLRHGFPAGEEAHTVKRIVAIREMLFSFRGRISRQMWWGAMLLAIVFMFLVGFLLRVLVLPRIENANIVFLVYLLVIFLGTWISLARDVKRLHDRNHRGEKVISYYICLNGFVYLCFGIPRWSEEQPLPLLICLGWAIYRGVQIAFLPGDKGENDYGPPPESLKVWWDRTGR